MKINSKTHHISQLTSVNLTYLGPTRVSPHPCRQQLPFRKLAVKLSWNALLNVPLRCRCPSRRLSTWIGESGRGFNHHYLSANKVMPSIHLFLRKLFRYDSLPSWPAVLITRKHRQADPRPFTPMASIGRPLPSGGASRVIDLVWCGIPLAPT